MSGKRVGSEKEIQQNQTKKKKKEREREKTYAEMWFGTFLPSNSWCFLAMGCTVRTWRSDSCGQEKHNTTTYDELQECMPVYIHSMIYTHPHKVYVMYTHPHHTHTKIGTHPPPPPLKHTHGPGYTCCWSSVCHSPGVW